MIAVARDPFRWRVWTTVEVTGGYTTLRPWMSAAVHVAQDAGAVLGEECVQHPAGGAAWPVDGNGTARNPVTTN
ncbi:hypothetical protein [Micromonospora sp. DT47]|uniref:hypothetical protein n=1 Tax=Micromonospora sp. DT47 TaxID=3393431 RepID=UPI003CF54447